MIWTIAFYAVLSYSIRFSVMPTVILSVMLSIIPSNLQLYSLGYTISVILSQSSHQLYPQLNRYAIRPSVIVRDFALEFSLRVKFRIV